MNTNANKAAVNLILNPALKAQPNKLGPLTPVEPRPSTGTCEYLVDRLHELTAETSSQLPPLTTQVHNKNIGAVIQPVPQSKVKRMPNDINVTNKLKFVETFNQKVHDSRKNLALTRNSAATVVIVRPADNKDGTASIQHVLTIDQTNVQDLLAFLDARKPPLREPGQKPVPHKVDFLDVAKEQATKQPVTADFVPNSSVDNQSQVP